jgi:hypothetical protein
MKAGQYNMLSSKRLGASDLCARTAFLYTVGNLGHRVQLTLKRRRRRENQSGGHPSRRWNPLRTSISARQEETADMGVTPAVLPGRRGGFVPCPGSLAGTSKSETSLSQIHAIAPQCSRLLAALGLRRVAGLFFERPWYASLPAMLLLPVAPKSIVRIVVYTCQSACERLELPQIVTKGQLGLLTMALTLMWVVLLDRPSGPRSLSFRRRGRFALPSTRSRGARYMMRHGIRGANNR